MTVSLNLDSIEFQSALRSKPVRDNFTDVQNACNDLQSQIDAINTPASGSEVTNARDYHGALRDRLRSASKASGNVVITGLEVTAQGSPDMTVHVAAGEAIVDGVACDVAAADSGTITAPASNPRYDVVVVNSDNSLSIVAGTEAASPTLPAISITQKAIARIYLTVGMTQILTANILDIREWGQQTYYPEMPIGSIIAWHKSFTGVPSLPSNWKECDGSVINDANSLLNGQTLPDLNGGNRFLRGNSTSGATGGSATHVHPFQGSGGSFAGGGNNTLGSTNGEPPYMNIVWIIRIK